MSSSAALLGFSRFLNLNVVECSSIFGLIVGAALAHFCCTGVDGSPGSAAGTIFVCLCRTSVDGSPSSVECLFVANLDFGIY